MAVSLSEKCNQNHKNLLHNFYVFLLLQKKTLPSCIKMSQVLTKISSRFAICIFSLSSFSLTDEFANYVFLSLLKSSYRDGSISSCESGKIVLLTDISIFALVFWK